MSEKTVVTIALRGSDMIITEPDGNEHTQPATEKVTNKMTGITKGYFFAKKHTEDGVHFTITRFAPFSEWDAATREIS